MEDYYDHTYCSFGTVVSPWLCHGQIWFALKLAGAKVRVQLHVKPTIFENLIISKPWMKCLPLCLWCLNWLSYSNHHKTFSEAFDCRLNIHLQNVSKAHTHPILSVFWIAMKSKSLKCFLSSSLMQEIMVSVCVIWLHCSQNMFVFNLYDNHNEVYVSSLFFFSFFRNISLYDVIISKCISKYSMLFLTLIVKIWSMIITLFNFTSNFW